MKTNIDPPLVFSLEKAREVVETLNADARVTGTICYGVEATPNGESAKILVIDETGETIGYL